MMARGLWMWSFPWLQEGRTELSIRPWGAVGAVAGSKLARAPTAGFFQQSRSRDNRGEDGRIASSGTRVRRSEDTRPNCCRVLTASRGNVGLRSSLRSATRSNSHRVSLSLSLSLPFAHALSKSGSSRPTVAPSRSSVVVGGGRCWLLRSSLLVVGQSKQEQGSPDGTGRTWPSSCRATQSAVV